MPQEIGSRHPTQRWTYSTDGRSATRIQDAGEVILTGEFPSRRPESLAHRPEDPEWRRWMPTLRFMVRNDRFVCELEVERLNVITVDNSTETKSYFHIVWNIDYLRMPSAWTGAN